MSAAIIKLQPRGRTYNTCLDVRNWIKTHTFPVGYGIFVDNKGKPVPEEVAFEFLCDQIERGYAVIPMSPECKNPCAQPGCPGFDYKGGGCGGHT